MHLQIKLCSQPHQPSSYRTIKNRRIFDWYPFFSVNFHIAKQIAQFAYTFLLQLAVVVEFFSIRIKLRLSIIRNLISIEKLSCWSKPSPLISVSSLRRTEEVRYLCYAFSKIIYNLHNFRHFIIGLVIHWPSYVWRISPVAATLARTGSTMKNKRKRSGEKIDGRMKNMHNA